MKKLTKQQEIKFFEKKIDELKFKIGGYYSLIKLANDPEKKEFYDLNKKIYISYKKDKILIDFILNSFNKNMKK